MPPMVAALLGNLEKGTKVARKSKAKCRVQAFITDTRNNGKLGTETFLYCVDQIVTHGNVTKMQLLCAKTCATDAGRFRVMSSFVFGKALKSDDGVLTYVTPTDVAGIVARAASVKALNVSFRADAMLALVCPAKGSKADSFDLAAWAKRSLARGGKFSVTAADMIAALQAEAQPK